MPRATPSSFFQIVAGVLRNWSVGVTAAVALEVEQADNGDVDIDAFVFWDPLGDRGSPESNRKADLEARLRMIAAYQALFRIPFE